MWRDITNATKKQWTIISSYEAWIKAADAGRSSADKLVTKLYQDIENLSRELVTEWETQTKLREGLARCEVERDFYLDEVRRLYRKYET
jgi:hypothetical protein